MHLLRGGGLGPNLHSLLTRGTRPRRAVAIPVTARMTLTRTNWPDVDDVVALNADAEVIGQLGHGRPMSAARVLAEEMPRLMAYNRRADRLGSWVARDRGTGSFLGWFMLRPVDDPLRTVELTYRLRRQVREQGYDLEGLLGMIEMARAAQVSTVTAITIADDLPARRLMEKAGLMLVPTLVGDMAGPTAPRSQVNYALDLTREAQVPAAAPSG